MKKLLGKDSFVLWQKRPKLVFFLKEKNTSILNHTYLAQFSYREHDLKVSTDLLLTTAF